ncbi:inositol 1,4,5-triphosphate receptor associated 2 isoform X1 [Rhinichthys klamathensis goyatoka]|uniref:inositol 1,4,5-triphosphate receptor associated 2 isoform X1 n=1 Tax=Rhinichthys klamathensis goyatoka TaxID=3034132 RepID=UPI0024B5BA80|nr:inositol 1,4,5-triphosphate receptor associated 2 isoform X1 [Rhinichthys klamathensis goyatoka]
MACEDQQVLNNIQTEDDSEEGPKHEDQISLEESFIERLGPNSVDMTEEELEAAFSRLSLAFHCDQFTLCQRLETEEHARDNAEENLKLEVERSMEVIETLKGMCLDIKRARLLQRLELCLNIIGGTIGRISNTAEVLGAVHQEAKVSHAVELMVAHVENLKSRHKRNSAVLEEMKKQMEKSSRERHFCEQREEIDSIEKLEKDPQKPQLRRRISTNVIAKQTQRQKVKESEAILSSVTNEISDRERESNTKKPDHTEDCLLMDRGQVVPREDSPSQTAMVNSPEETSSAQILPSQTLRLEPDPVYVKNQKRNTSSLPVLPHQRLKSKAALDHSHAWLKRSERYFRDCDRCVISLQRPLMQWMYHCRWIILVIYLTVLCSIIILAILVWLLQTPVLWM